MQKESLFGQLVGTRSEMALVLFMVGILLVLFTPIPSGLLDFLLLLNVSFGLLILLLTFIMDKPLSFSTFPSLLLMATLFRLSLNIAATRLILDGGDAGHVIGSIGEYVVGGNYVIGLVVFFILIVVQYVVVTNGAQRVAEVAARFTLDSMPGKQMAIDADLNMGLIDAEVAGERRKEIEREASFYGSMDGASKFVKGDAIAGIIIIIIDIVGGLTIGVAQLGMDWGSAMHTYTLLTVGDGIVTQIPALIISTATGIIVTRAATDAQLGEEIVSQVSSHPKSLVIVSVCLSFLLFLPGIPVLPVSIIIGLLIISIYFSVKKFRDEYNEENSVDDDSVDEELVEQDIYQDIAIEPIELELGTELLSTLGVDDGEFMKKIKAFRKQYALDQGFVFPSVKLRDNKQLSDKCYVMRVNNAKVAEGEIYLDRSMAISVSKMPAELNGIETQDPTYNLPAQWIENVSQPKAKELGCTIVDPVTVLFTHFSETMKRYSFELLSRTETDKILKRLREMQPNLMEELVPGVLSVSDLQTVLQNLLREKVSIRNIDQICEYLVDSGRHSKDVDYLAEGVRGILGRAICESLVNNKNELHVLSLDPALEQIMQSGLRMNEAQTSLLVDPRISESMFASINKLAEKMMREQHQPILICSPQLRRHIRKMTERFLAHLSVLSLNEIPNDVNIVSAGIVKVGRDVMDVGRLSQQRVQPLTAQPKSVQGAAHE